MKHHWFLLPLILAMLSLRSPTTLTIKINRENRVSYRLDVMNFSSD
jgi:hypothetical protein